MKKNKKNQQVVIYQAKSGALEIKSDRKHSTIWASQGQIAEIFNVERSVITKHIRNILADKELDKKSVCAKFAHTGTDNKTYQVQYYNLDIILAVGYRANSTRAIEFRKWATKTLRRYIQEGYVMDRKRITKNYQNFLEAVNDIKQLMPAGKVLDADSILELVTLFADTWFSLDAYDKNKLISVGATKKRVGLAADQLYKILAEFKKVLVRQGKATDLFGQERAPGSISGIFGNTLQSFSGNDLYPSVEEKAAHLLYFMVKDHPFIDGNKRNGAYAFIWFLSQAGILNKDKMTASALTALTILVAESNPKEKNKMIRLILTLLVK